MGVVASLVPFAEGNVVGNFAVVAAVDVVVAGVAA